ncbi:hypothetical protein [Adhaeribacter rhizoryzae]|uniref:Uncharacterized protein n=1 Tax=Adhaeribacter rhizoryzae TaxID=2607907 RepID=A0A5M6DG89_9BACT|nr:hypothetical protein [Adhaeribacter rhizoryzae]KAA5546511.1 hypothetical protein F0145_11520 [Adhaeribacter rhizoryzae]
MKKFTNLSPLFALLVFTAMLFFSSCSSQKQHFSFTPAPPAYVKKQAPAPVKTTPTEINNTDTDAATLSASATLVQATVLPEVAALESSKAESNNKTATTYKAGLAAPVFQKSQKLTLAQKVVMHKVQKQVKKLSTQAKAAAGPVSNRNAIALVLIGIILAVFATLIGGGLGNLFYTLGILILLVGLILLILNYV